MSKFKVGDPVVYVVPDSQQYMKKAVVRRVNDHGAYDIHYNDGSTLSSRYVRETSLKFQTEIRTAFITLPGGAEFDTVQLACAHGANLTILKTEQERTPDGWKIISCSGPLDVFVGYQVVCEQTKGYILASMYQTEASARVHSSKVVRVTTIDKEVVSVELLP